ncbi:MAG TPA: hypothetical protein VLA96_05840 [Terriglobales bacterium]|nr:hypothetical protein [Terriglobales bacterium]
MSWKKAAGLALFVVILLGAGLLAWRYRMKQPEFVVELSVPSSAFTHVVLLADGRPVAEGSTAFRGVDRPTLSAHIAGHPRRSYGREMFPELSARLEGPCGSETAEVRLQTRLDPSEMQRALARGVAMTVQAYTQRRGELADESADVWVDNREHAEVKLVVGGHEEHVAANSKGVYHISYQPACAAGREVRLDDQLIGEVRESVTDIPLDGTEYHPLDMKYSRNYLVDTSGKRCYTYSLLCYVRPGGFGCSEARSYRGKLLHRIPGEKVHYFLEPSPERLEVPGHVTMEWRYRLSSGSCGWYE